MSLKSLTRAPPFLDYIKASGGRHSGDLFDIAVAQIEVEEGFNPREETDPDVVLHVREIANSILSGGFDRDETLKIRYVGGHVYVRDGHCRLWATRLAISEGAEIVTIPCKLMARGTDETDETYQVLTTQTKLPLTPVAWATQIKKLIRQGQSEEQIAERLGKPRDFIARMLDLAEAPAEVREAVKAKQISATEAVNVVRRNGSDASAVIGEAVALAQSEGRSKARPRDVERVAPVVKVSVHSLAEAFAKVWKAWDHGDIPTAVIEAADALAARFG